MTISRELMLSIFSLNSYNRGYSVGMLVEGSGIGSASIASDEYTAAQQASSFYATAYNWNGETIISYRGTRFDGLAGPECVIHAKLRSNGRSGKLSIEEISMTTSAPLAEKDARRRSAPGLVGMVRRFGHRGVPYEVLRALSADDVLIRVITTGEETRYPIADVLTDPED